MTALVKMNKISSAKRLKQATPKRMKKWFKDAFKFVPQDISERIDAAISADECKEILRDPAGPALTFCVDIMKAPSSNVAVEVLNDVDQLVKLIESLVDKFGVLRKLLR